MALRLEMLPGPVASGGGNFGVVTSFLFQGQPVHTIYGGPMFWPLEQAADVMKWLAVARPALVI
jgi:hypothetical protein